MMIFKRSYRMTWHFFTNRNGNVVILSEHLAIHIPSLLDPKTRYNALLVNKKCATFVGIHQITS